MKIKMTDEQTELDLKRCYLPIEITDTCPTCGAEVTRHLSSDYLSYPCINTSTKISMYHHIELQDRDDEHSWEVVVILRVTAEAETVKTAEPPAAEAITVDIPANLAQDVASALESQANRYRMDKGHAEDGIAILNRDADRLDALAEIIMGLVARHGDT